MVERTLKRFENDDVTLGVIGLGYVGLPLAVEAGKAGLKVLGFEVSQRVAELVNRGESHIQDVPAQQVAALRKKGLLEATTDMGRLVECDAVSICVPTPLSKTRDPDVSYILAATQSVAAALRPGQLIVLESTTYPGTTREIMLPALEARGMKVGEDFFLCFSPERVDPGNPTWQTKNTPKVIGGITPECARVGETLYRRFIDTVVPVSSAEAAELTKLLENTFRAVNIGLVNETALISDRLGVNVWEVIEAAGTKPFGFMKFLPGPGLGGHCIPIDPFYLAWKARQHGLTTRFIELAGEVNVAMPRYVVGKVAEALKQRGKPLKGSKVLLLGLAYKKDVDDVRESPSLVLIELLRSQGAEVDYNDPHVPHTHPMREHDLRMASKPLSAAMLRRYDAVLISTDHSAYDYDFIVRHAQLVIDTRNATRDVQRGRRKIVKA